jgi:hypothetical protein
MKRMLECFPMQDLLFFCFPCNITTISLFPSAAAFINSILALSAQTSVRQVRNLNNAVMGFGAHKDA